MKTKVIATLLFTLTAATVILYPAANGSSAVKPPQIKPPLFIPSANNPNERPKVDVVFVLDTTGSMSGMIDAAKEKIWSVATTMASAQPAPEIRVGLVAYRDRGDAYVTQITDLSTDLDSMYATLMQFRADGGGDGPESVNQALHEAVEKLSWSQNQQAYKVIFLVGDAPPHMDYPGEVQYPATLAAAQQRGIIVNTIQAGQDNSTARQWQQIAQLGAGDYFQVEQGGGALAVESPFDHELADLSAKLDDTRLYYGDAKEKAQQQRKVDATKKVQEEATPASLARRATFNTSASGAANLLGDKELVDDVISGKVALDKLDNAALPAPLQAMAPEEQRKIIQQTATARQELKAKIEELSSKRNDYLKKEVDALGSTAKDNSLDIQLFDTVKKQAEAKGMVYKADAPNY